ncbi:hypothetical protein [Microbacterium sp. PRC9]|uniref:hypothetical protein n=1 Tax=Microbacterium sp. PRC9 TaxID=2962591 RepID=UPI002881B06B|nr:hypothetical protein [Microbacterium sp. PRC9]MDT0141967.1 hypothetical protein [Microbacterium sp. PRC9]
MDSINKCRIVPSNPSPEHPRTAMPQSPLSALLAFEPSDERSLVEYEIGGIGLIGDDREAAAQMIADDGMVVACGASSVLMRWRDRRDGGVAQEGARLEALRTFMNIGFGLPDRQKNPDHVQGHVAELLWSRVIGERRTCRDGRAFVTSEPIKADPLEPGGDGLVVYKSDAGTLVFRLWEIKKHDSSARVSQTINRAGKQLKTRGHEYLAKIAGPSTLTATGDLAELYDSMLDLWFDRSSRAGVGVAVSASDEHAPTGRRAFKSLRTHFPAFTETGQTESLVFAVPDFPGFVNRVQEIVWSGL